MPTHNHWLVMIAGILLVAQEIGPVIANVTSSETIATSPGRTVNTPLTTAPTSSIPDSSLTTTRATTPFEVTTTPPLAPTSSTPSATSSSLSSLPTVLSTSVPSSSSIPITHIGTSETTTLATHSSAMSEPSTPDATSASSMPRLNPTFTLTSSVQFPTESPGIAMTTSTRFPGTTDSGSETSFSLYLAIPLGSATFCAILILFACLMCIWCKRIIKIKTRSKAKEEGGVPTEMYVLDNSLSKGDTLRFGIPDESTKTFEFASTFTTQPSDQTPISTQTMPVISNQPMPVSDGSEKEDLVARTVETNPALECGPETDAYVKISRVSSLPRSYHLSIKHPTQQESQTSHVIMKTARSLSSISTREAQGKRQLSSPLSGNADMKSKVYAAPMTTAGVMDQQQIDNLEQLKHTQRPTRTSSVGALHSKAAAESTNSESKGNEGLYDVPRATLLQRASDNPRSMNAVAARVQRNTANESEPSSHYDIPKHALAMLMAQRQELHQHPPDSNNNQSSDEHTSSAVPTSTSGHYDIPKKVQASLSSSGHKLRANPQTAIQRHPTHPKVKPTPNIQVPRPQGVVDQFATYDIPRRAATLPNYNAQGGMSLYDVPRQRTGTQNGKESSNTFLSDIMHSGGSTHQSFPDQVHTMPRFGDHNPEQVQEKYIPQSANSNMHDYQTIHRSPADTVLDDEDSDSSSEHLYDQPPLEFLEEVRQMAKKRQTSSEAEVLLPSNPSQPNCNVEAPANPNALQKMPPPVKQKPVGKRPVAAKQL